MCRVQVPFIRYYIDYLEGGRFHTTVELLRWIALECTGVASSSGHWVETLV